MTAANLNSINKTGMQAPKGWNPIINGNIHFRAVRGAIEREPEDTSLATSKIRLRLNQQQIELTDNTIRSGESNSRDDLVRRALRQVAKANLPAAGKDK